jgi:hypothetical protein
MKWRILLKKACKEKLLSEIFTNILHHSNPRIPAQEFLPCLSAQ